MLDSAHSALKAADLAHAHSIMTDYEDLFADDDDTAHRQVLVFSGNDETALKANARTWRRSDIV